MLWSAEFDRLLKLAGAEQWKLFSILMASYSYSGDSDDPHLLGELELDESED